MAGKAGRGRADVAGWVVPPFPVLGIRDFRLLLPTG
jgi:hypothetical protein